MAPSNLIISTIIYDIFSIIYDVLPIKNTIPTQKSMSIIELLFSIHHIITKSLTLTASNVREIIKGLRSRAMEK